MVVIRRRTLVPLSQADPHAGAPQRDANTSTRAGCGSLGPGLRRAWVGYQRRLDEALAAAGFERQLPDGRVLRICAQSEGATISQIGRQLGITRQGASKLVAGLSERRYVTIAPSPHNGREKIVALTPHAIEYLAAHRTAARAIERQLRSEIGNDPFESLQLLLAALGADEQPRMRDYLRRAVDPDSRR
jgi:DNA-binding MarR family transcriptional regulator